MSIEDEFGDIADIMKRDPERIGTKRAGVNPNTRKAIKKNDSVAGTKGARVSQMRAHRYGGRADINLKKFE